VAGLVLILAQQIQQLLDIIDHIILLNMAKLELMLDFITVLEMKHIVVAKMNDMSLVEIILL